MKKRTILLSSLFFLYSDLRLGADVVTDWNTAALNAIRDGNTAPPAAARNLAILHGAVYDYFQNNAFDARSLLQPSPQSDILRQNQFGAVFGGSAQIRHVSLTT